ncbi:hypothetical protein K503DRAFT_496781 [Rhizopogon vinicolor AM-OR11-026]|uniref:Uncharacterized protein n=1 Tax=Rhizopogon vinicolor AM-OR11-026 TaxID=1314800 RepID=A0A1B7MM85_9AGAM|nr:hypothetical protein K503DRAFT_496781 [Rhizopogon vinicolor AM-OR11-026]
MSCWKLANVTPRWILLDSAFIQALRFRSYLGWKQSRNPTFSDLYSRGNFDHARRLINTLRFARFPSGTVFEDMELFTWQYNTTFYLSTSTTRTISVDSETLRVCCPCVYFKDQIAVTDVTAAALEDVSMTLPPSAQGSSRRTRPFQTHLMRHLLVLPGMTAVPSHIPPTRAQLSTSDGAIDQ